ncbi:MAG: hypothetical protein ACLU2L_01105, partial [Fenollaria timonensis]
MDAKYILQCVLIVFGIAALGSLAYLFIKIASTISTMKSMMEENRLNIGQTVAKLPEVMNNVNGITSNVNGLVDDIRPDIKEMTVEAKGLVRDLGPNIKSVTDDVSTLVTELRPNISGIMSNINGVTSDVSKLTN